MLESVREAADRPRELTVDRIARAAGRRRVMSLVENQQRSGAEVLQQVAQAADVGFVRHQRMGDEEARSGRPWARAISALAPQDVEVLAVDDREGEPELRFEFVLPLADHPGRGGDEDEVDPPAKQQFAHDQSRLDGLAGADVVGDQQIHPREAQRFLEGEKLIGVLMNAGPERRLEQVPVGRCGGVPAESAEVGGKDARIVGPQLGDVRPPLVDQDLGVEFGVPKDRDSFTLGVVVDAGEADCVQAADQGPILDEPTARTNANEFTRLRYSG